jgi:hypothetical protein
LIQYLCEMGLFCFVLFLFLVFFFVFFNGISFLVKLTLLFEIDFGNKLLENRRELAHK